MRRTIQLPNHVIRSIFERLPLHDLARTKALSSFWNSVTESLLSARFPKAPWLLLPPKQGSTSCLFINVEGNMEKTTSGVFHEFHCIGSSCGLLIFLDGQTLSPFLLNPFTNVRIDLPSLKTPFCISRTEYVNPSVLFWVSINGEWKYRYSRHAKGQWKYFVTKAVLTGEPIGDYGVILMCNHNGITQIVYYKNGDSSWTKLIDDRYAKNYNDIIYCQNKIYASWGSVMGCVIDTWDIDLEGNHPRKGIEISPNNHDFSQLMEKVKSSIIDDCIISGYIVESEGEVLFIFKFTNFRVSKTEFFQVLKFDLEERIWIEVKSLGDRSLFLGRNHSVSVSTTDLKNCKGNSIYFANDCWHGMLDGSRGHDVGIYSLEDKSVSPVLEFEVSRRNAQPQPCWIVPADFYVQSKLQGMRI